MTAQDTTRRLSPQILSQDVDSLNGLRTIEAYSTTRKEATLEALEQAYEEMLAKQREETEKQMLAKAAADAARLAEWEFHNTVLAMKEVVKGQFGSDSDAAQAVGLKKKSDRKRRSRRKADSPVANGKNSI